MKAKTVLVGAMASLLTLYGMTFSSAQNANAAPLHTIEEVMEQGHKDGLLKKILAGEGSSEDKLKLLDLYVSMIESEPPKGDMASWQNLAGKAALAAAKVATGREGSLDELKAATNCAACHKLHKAD